MTDAIVLRSRVLGGSPPAGAFAVPAAYDAATLAWVAAVVANGGTVSTTRQNLVDALVRGLKGDGIWRKLDRLWLLAGENAPQALTDVVADVLATANASPAFAANLGYTGVDASATVSIETGFDPTAAGINYGVNSAHLSVWSNLQLQSSGSGGKVIGHDDSGANNQSTEILPYYSDGNAYFRIIDSPGSGGFANAISTGLITANRSGAAATQGYIGGALFASPNETAGTFSNRTVLILNAHGAPAGSALQVSAASIGGSLTALDVSNLNSRLCDFLGGAYAAAWAAQVVSNGGAVSAIRQTLVTGFIAGCLHDQTWYKMDRAYVLAGENDVAARTDIRALTLASKVGSPAVAANFGYNSFSDSNYLDTGFNASTATPAPQFSGNLGHMAAWLAIGPAVSGFREAIGAFDLSRFADLFETSNNWQTRINDTTALSGIGFNPPNDFFAAAIRTGASARTLYGNGAGGPQSVSDSTAASVLVNANFCLGNRSNPAAGSGFTGGTIGFASIGGAITTADTANMYSRVSTLIGGCYAARWAAAVAANGGSVTPARQNLVAALIAGMVFDGTWGPLDRLWLFANENSISSLTDIRGCTLATTSSGPAFATDRGFTGDGIASYIDTGFNPATASNPAFSANLGSLLLWSNTAASNANGAAGNSTGSVSLYPNQGGAAFFEINESAFGNTAAVVDGRGFYLANRSAGSGVGCEQGYKNGVQICTSGPSSTGVVNSSTFCLSTGGAFWAGQLACVGIGYAFSATDVLNIYNRLRTYMAAVGVA
jgi:hypothetical protein